MLSTDPRSEAICRVCKKPYIRFQTTQTVCGVRCAKQVGKLARKAERESVKKRKEAVKSRSQWMKEAQDAFNAYIRARDAQELCISCGRNHQGQWHAGHFYSVGARPELRFHEDNCHKQCKPCNTDLHGNLLKYREALMGRIGSDRMEALAGPVAVKKYTVEDLKQIRATYRAKAKEIEG